MTPDELFTRVHRQRAEMIVSELAMDALMSVLPPDVQQKWLSALQALEAKRSAFLASRGADPTDLAQSSELVRRRVLRLQQAARPSE